MTFLCYNGRKDVIVLNPNVEVINPHLWGVKFSWINAGWLADFNLVTDRIENLDATLTNCGQILLNKDNLEGFEILKVWFNERIMPLSDKELQQTIQESKQDEKLELISWMLDMEQKRRAILKAKR